jgi:SAM-dependent methyltransferase
LVTTTPLGTLAALANAARIVQPNGRIVLLMDGRPSLPESFQAIRDASEPEEVRSDDPDVRLWINAITHARLGLFSDLEATAAEDLFATAVPGPEQVQRLVARSGDCLILEDGHRSLAVVE